ncbi:efflux RND transporter periplasmic adaptor subunit [Paraburkholderia sp. IMGN_8]|uniref:efflux RND transporter periplasmic adaptor subunit n=1 Tax=Paraburkholderia sp. IMGN_8 TaxID=3136564 RepID=UPI0031010FA4
MREFTGRIEQTSISPLAFEVSGRIVEIAVRDGGAVKKGQLIARIDAEPYELQLRRADAQYTQLAEDLKRKAVLHDEGILSGASFDQLKAAVEMALAQRDLARRDLRNTRLVAPFDGRVARRNVESQQTVSAGMLAFNFENVGRLEVGVELPQSVIETLSASAALSGKAWLPERPEQPFDLVYRERSTLITPSASSYRLLFGVAQPVKLPLLPGMIVRVRLDLGPQHNDSPGFAVPVGSLSVAPDGHRRLWRYDRPSGQVHAVPVDVRAISGGDAVVAGALNVGDQVVAGGVQFVAEGLHVRSMDANPQ